MSSDEAIKNIVGRYLNCSDFQLLEDQDNWILPIPRVQNTRKIVSSSPYIKLKQLLRGAEPTAAQDVAWEKENDTQKLEAEHANDSGHHPTKYQLNQVILQRDLLLLMNSETCYLCYITRISWDQSKTIFLFPQST